MIDFQHKADLLYQIEERKNAPRSKGEGLVESFLKKKNIDYITEYFFNNLKTKDTKLFLFFDFYLPKLKTVIEVHGKHHFEQVEGFGRHERIKKLDEIKFLYCLKNKIRYISVAYTDGTIDLNRLNDLLFNSTRNFTCNTTKKKKRRFKHKQRKPKVKDTRILYINGQGKRSYHQPQLQ